MHSFGQRLPGLLVLAVLIIPQTGCSQKMSGADGIDLIETNIKDVNSAQSSRKRTVLLLDGIWQVAQGSMDQPPEHFDRTVPVPGMMDMAEPTFGGVGTISKLREAFWYRKTFKLSIPVPETTLRCDEPACRAVSSAAIRLHSHSRCGW